MTDLTRPSGLLDDVVGEEARDARDSPARLPDRRRGRRPRRDQLGTRRKAPVPAAGRTRAWRRARSTHAAEVAELAELRPRSVSRAAPLARSRRPGPRLKTTTASSTSRRCKSVRANLEMGMSLESIREINRVLGASLSQLAVMVERQFLATYHRPDARRGRDGQALRGDHARDHAGVRLRAAAPLQPAPARRSCAATSSATRRRSISSPTRARSRSASPTSSASPRSANRFRPMSSARSPSASARSRSS